MKTFIFLFCTTVFGFSPSAIFSQNAKITIDADKTATVDEVFDLIRKQTKYTFIYQEDLFKNTPKVQLKKGIIKADNLLEESLSNGAFEVIVTKNSTILIKEKIIKNEAQQEVKGKVTDEKGIPLIGASVTDKATKIGVITDANGEYILTSNQNGILIFSYLGFKTIEIPINGRNTINVKMQEDEISLQDVVVNAGYYKTSKKTSTGSISKVDAKAIEQQPVSNALAALSGRMAGVEITQSSAYAGGGFKVRVRGQNSIAAGNEPLYIIDGTPYDSKSMSDLYVSQIFNGDLNPFSIINPSDIESVEVLKDSDATAIYGSRGANGVMLITTKKGKEQKAKLSVSFNSSYGKITKFQKLLTTKQFIETTREAYANDGVDYTTSGYAAIDGTWPEDRYTDWQKVLMGETAQTNDVQVSLSGGDRNTQYFLSGSYRTETAIIIGDNKYKRGTVLAKTNHTSKDDRFKLSFSANYSVDDGSLPAYDAGFAAATLAPNAPAMYNEDGTINFDPNFQNNPAINLSNYYENNRFALLSSVDLSYKILPSLEFKTNLGYSSTSLEDFTAFPATITYAPPYNDSKYSNVTRNNSSRKSWTIEPQINWEHAIGKGKLTWLTGISFQNQTDKKLLTAGQGFPSDELITNLSAATKQYITGDDKTQYKYNAIFGRVNYNWQGKYLVNLTGRRDGSSRFGPNNKFANFGAIGAGWVFSKESFIEDTLPFISFGKLRGSYGTSGNDQIGDYQFLDTYSIVPYQTYGGSGVMDPTRLYNPDFAWEINKKFELGLELGFLKDRIQITTMYYQNISDNQLVGIPLPSTTGFTSLTANLDAKVKNTGFEVEINTVNFQSENFHWTSTFNITFPKNELLAFPGLEASTYANTYVIGQPLSIKKLYHNLGVNPQTGIYEFEDYNKDGLISGAADRQYIKDLASEYYGGLGNNIKYKNWDFDTFFQFSRKVGFNFLAQVYTFGNQPALTLDNRWHNPGDQAFLQRYTMGYNSEASIAADRFSNSNDAYTPIGYIRLKNISIGYTIPEFKSSGIKCRIYLQGQNLFTFTKFKGPDPEAPVQSNNIVKTLNFGVNLIF